MTKIPEFYMPTGTRTDWPETARWAACKEYRLTDTVSLYELFGMSDDGYAVTWFNNWNWYDEHGDPLEPKRIAPDNPPSEQESILAATIDDARAAAKMIRRRYGLA